MTREEARKELRRYRIYSPTKEIREAIDMAIEALMTDIVRCGECRFSEEDYPLRTFPNRTEEQARQRWCDHSTYSHDKDFFCGYGERREE